MMQGDTFLRLQGLRQRISMHGLQACSSVGACLTLSTPYSISLPWPRLLSLLVYSSTSEASDRIEHGTEHDPTSSSRPMQ